MELPASDQITKLATNPSSQKSIVFFLFYARFEYALTETRWYQKNRLPEVWADWRGYGAHMDSKLNQSSNVAAAITYLTTNPPRKKKVGPDGQIVWMSGTISGKGLAQVLSLVVCVRNNLFHGGKSPERSLLETDRNTKLIGACMTILSACLDADLALNRCFFENLG
jgi:hypothetical protein